MRRGTNTFLFLLLLCCSHTSFYAQDKKLDSLLTVLRSAKEGTNKVTTLNVLSESLWRTANSPQGMKYAEEALVLAKKLNFDRGIIDAYENIGSHYEYQGNYPEALKNHFTALKIAESLENKNEIAYCYLLIAADCEEQGRTHPNDSLRKELFSEALKYNFAALKIVKETGHKRYACMLYNNIGVVYRDQDNRSEAVKNFSASLKIAEELELKGSIATTSSNIGGIYNALGDHDKALEFFLNALKKSSEIDDRREISASHLDIGTTYMRLQENSKARWHLNQGLAIAKEMRNKEYLVDAYATLSGLDSAEGNWKAAYVNHKLFTLYRDSLNNEESSKKFIQTQMQYEFDKKEDSLKQKQTVAEVRLQAQERQKNFYLIGAILLALLSFFVFLNFRNQRKANRLMNVAYEKERAELELHSVRAQLNPHFMFNSLNAIQELILKEDFDNSHTYLARFAKLVRMLLENAEKPFVPLNQEVNFLELYLSLEKLRIPDLRFFITVDSSIDMGKTLLPNMVLQPYIENALWHGLSQKSGDKSLELIIHKQNGAIIYNVQDNGVGRKKAAEFKSLYRKEHKSKGMELLTRRFKLLNEEFGFEIKTEVSDVMNDGEAGGTLVSINVPNSLSENFKTQLQ
jgi:tetratricopeptide (TPR) repeat protein